MANQGISLTKATDVNVLHDLKETLDAEGIDEWQEKDPKADAIDELLNSVDLSSYGLQRVKLNHCIRLNEDETELEPQNPNPRGAHGGDEAHGPGSKKT